MSTVRVELTRTPRARETAPTPTAPTALALDAGEQYRFGFSMSACIGCHSCEVACAEQNGLPSGTVWRRVGEVEGGAFPDTRRLQLSMSCNHCLDAACLTGCPINAYEKLSNGIVAHHADDCIGCQYCTWNCPYSVPVFQPDRRIVTKCDMCKPRLDVGLEPACVDACPTHAITVEKVDVAAWRADHSEADMPHLPSSDLTISTTRIELPDDVPVDSIAASDWNVTPEHPHWPLVWLTVLTQVAVGVSTVAADDTARVVAAVLAAAALAGSLAHLGRPAVAWKALRNLRRSWLSREVLLFGLYAPAAAAAVIVPAAGVVAAIIGWLGVYPSARLYVVPGRPAWNTPLTFVAFAATGLAVGPLVGGHPWLAVAGTAASLAALGSNIVRLHGDPEVSRGGTAQLYLGHLRPWTIARVVLAAAAGIAVAAGAPMIALAPAVVAEVIGRWLFYVTVVPANMPGSFWRGAAGSHR